MNDLLEQFILSEVPRNLKTTFYGKSNYFKKSNWRRVLNRVHLFIIKPFQILIIQT